LFGGRPNLDRHEEVRGRRAHRFCAIRHHDIDTHLEGNFPGGTVDLTNRFGLRDGYVASLEIVPVGR